MIALVLAAIGIYGVIAYSVSQRTLEIGIRSALGARSGHTLQLVAKQAVWLTTIGLIVGTGLGVFTVKFLGSQLVAVGQAGADGPLTFIAVGCFFLMIAVLASSVPASRAMRIDPVVALRDER